MSAPVIEFHPKMNIFDSNATILVNAVNRVGVMGGGIAKAFKDRYPLMYQSYRYFCEQMMNVHEDWLLHVWWGDDPHDPIIANLPTKDHWKEDSSMELIMGGMGELISLAARSAKTAEGPVSVAVPKLGCGLGNLEWSVVRPAIVNAICAQSDKLESYSIRWMILGEEG